MLDPADAGWQRLLGLAHGSVGGIAQEHGDLDAAERSYRQALAIAERLAGLDPANGDWQLELELGRGISRWSAKTLTPPRTPSPATWPFSRA